MIRPGVVCLLMAATTHRTVVSQHEVDVSV
jgi:hypothetical protein